MLKISSVSASPTMRKPVGLIDSWSLYNSSSTAPRFPSLEDAVAIALRESRAVALLGADDLDDSDGGPVAGDRVGAGLVDTGAISCQLGVNRVKSAIRTKSAALGRHIMFHRSAFAVLACASVLLIPASRAQ